MEMGVCENVISGNFDDEMIKLNKFVSEIEDQFWVKTECLMEIASDMEAMMKKGLENQDSSFIKMLVTYIHTLPTGDEEGCYYALDLGGTNLRVMRVKLQGDKTIDLKSESYIVPHKLKIGTSDELFDYIAEKVSSFIKKEEASDFVVLPGRKKELGFTFSFPVDQTRINSGTLLNWTKDYDIDEAIHRDMVKELTEALERSKVDINVTALLNDTVGTLAGGRFYDKNVIAAVILGTGLNAAYVEKTKNILKNYGPPPMSGQMVINTEWGNFNSPSLPLTEFDRGLDEDSPNPQKQVLEKMISGRYLGEIVRRVILWLAEEAGLFGNVVPTKLREAYMFGTHIVSAIHSDKSADLDIVAKSMKEVMEVTNISFERRQLIVKICEIVSTRGARISAASILAILKRLGKDKATEGETIVAVDGALFGRYKQFKSCLEQTLTQELLDKNVSKTVVLKQYKDASGIGAALVAASNSIYRH